MISSQQALLLGLKFNNFLVNKDKIVNINSLPLTQDSTLQSAPLWYFPIPVSSLSLADWAGQQRTSWLLPRSPSLNLNNHCTAPPTVPPPSLPVSSTQNDNSAVRSSPCHARQAAATHWTELTDGRTHKQGSGYRTILGKNGRYLIEGYLISFWMIKISRIIYVNVV